MQWVVKSFSMKLNLLKWNVALFKEIGGDGSVAAINAFSTLSASHG